MTKFISFHSLINTTKEKVLLVFYSFVLFFFVCFRRFRLRVACVYILHLKFLDLFTATAYSDNVA